MDVTNAEQAREWLQVWGPRAFKLGRAESLANDMDTCALLCPTHSPVLANGYREAAATLRAAVAGLS